jgi:hypothetical protein
MEQKEKHHYRKVFKSDHLGVADLEDLIEEKKSLIFTIKHVKQEYDVTVAGKKGNFNIAYFAEPIKPLVLNAGNSKIIKSFCNGSPFVEDWKNVLVELTIDANVKFGKDMVSGVRIRPSQPKAKIKPEFTEVNFEKAFINKATIEQIKSIYNLTPEMEQKFKDYGTSKK